MIKVYTKQELDAELKKHKAVLAVFYASWCPFCAGFVRTFDKKAASSGFKSVIHVLLDDYNNQLWDDYEVTAVPTIIFFEDGKICKRLDGKLGIGLSDETFRKWIAQLKNFRLHS